MTMGRMGGYGAAGGKQIRIEDEKSEFQLPLKFDATFIAACEGITVLLFLVAICMGAWTIPILVFFASLLAVVFGFVAFRVNPLSDVRFCLFLAAVFAAFSVIWRVELWEWLSAASERRHMWEAIVSPWHSMPYIALAALVVVGAFLRIGLRDSKVATAIVVCVILSVLLVLYGPGWSGWDTLRSLLVRLRWVPIAFAWPIVVGLAMIALVSVKEMFWPALSHTLQPIAAEDWKTLGLFGAWFPRLGQWLTNVVFHSGPKREVLGSLEVVYGKHSDTGRFQETIKEFPVPQKGDQPMAIGYFCDLINGEATISEACATKDMYGWTQRQYRGWDDRQGVHNLGLIEFFEQMGFTLRRGNHHEITDDGLSFLVTVVATEFGAYYVPKDLHLFVPASLLPSPIEEGDPDDENTEENERADAQTD